MSDVVGAPAIERFLAAAAGAGLPVDVQRYPAGTRTAADAAAAIGCELGAIVKSLVFMAEPEGAAPYPVMALVSGANRADPRRLAEHFAVPVVRQATADEARAATGFAIGGTPPLGHASAIPVVVDADLLAFAQVWAAAGTPDSVWPIAPERLVEVLAAPVLAVTR